MNSYVPSGFWVYSPTKSPTVVSPSPATVIRPGNAASTRLVLPVPGGPYSSAGTPAARSLRSASTSGMSASALGRYTCPPGRVTGPGAAGGAGAFGAGRAGEAAGFGAAGAAPGGA